MMKLPHIFESSRSRCVKPGQSPLFSAAVTWTLKLVSLDSRLWLLSLVPYSVSPPLLLSLLHLSPLSLHLSPPPLLSPPLVFQPLLSPRPPPSLPVVSPVADGSEVVTSVVSPPLFILRPP